MKETTREQLRKLKDMLKNSPLKYVEAEGAQR